jgi:hypothetical protein
VPGARAVEFSQKAAATKTKKGLAISLAPRYFGFGTGLFSERLGRPLESFVAVRLDSRLVFRHSP